MAEAHKLPSGSWRAQVYVGKDPNGKRIYESFTADTKKKPTSSPPCVRVNWRSAYKRIARPSS